MNVIIKNKKFNMDFYNQKILNKKLLNCII